MTYDELTALLASIPEDQRATACTMLARELPTTSLDDIADDMKRRAYHGEIRSMVEDYKRRVAAGEFESRDDLLEDITQTCDGHHDVIYTACAMDVVRYSDNDGAYVDNFGAEGLVEGGAIQWSRLAFAAMEADLFEALRAEGIDVNDEPDDWAGSPANDPKDEE